MQPMAQSQYSFVVSTSHSQLLTAACVITIHELRELPFSFLLFSLQCIKNVTPGHHHKQA